MPDQKDLLDALNCLEDCLIVIQEAQEHDSNNCEYINRIDKLIVRLQNGRIDSGKGWNSFINAHERKQP